MKNLVFGHGVNDANYTVQIKVESGVSASGKRKQKVIWHCPFYSRWCGVLERSYSKALHKTRPSYIGCSTTPEWHYFMTFRAWMEKQDWQDKHLDKDILFIGNKVYGPNTCVFVDARTNSFLIEKRSSNNGWPVGVHYDKRHCKFVSQINDLETGKRKFLGYYDDALVAHQAWLYYKLEQAKILASQQTDERVAKALVARYENYQSF